MIVFTVYLSDRHLERLLERYIGVPDVQFINGQDDIPKKSAIAVVVIGINNFNNIPPEYRRKKSKIKFHVYVHQDEKVNIADKLRYYSGYTNQDIFSQIFKEAIKGEQNLKCEKLSINLIRSIRKQELMHSKKKLRESKIQES